MPETPFLPDQQSLEALEAHVQRALKSLDMSGLQELGFGESTIVSHMVAYPSTTAVASISTSSAGKISDATPIQVEAGWFSCVK